MTTLKQVKKAGWVEVERQQQELANIKRIAKDKPFHQSLIAELTGKIQGMVYILNMLK